MSLRRWIRETVVKQLADEESGTVAKDLAKAAAKGAVKRAEERIDEQAQKLLRPLTSAIDDYQKKKADERAERAKKEKVERDELDIDAELAELKRKLSQ